MLHRSGTVGAVFPTVDNAIFAKAIEALQRRLTDAGLQLLIATSGYDVDTEARQAMNLVTRGADALALCGVGQSPQLLKFLRQRALPTVHVMTYPAPAETVCVGFDNAKAIGQAVRYLLDLGTGASRCWPASPATTTGRARASPGSARRSRRRGSTCRRRASSSARTGSPRRATAFAR
jgi:DNA-binding LacI/PurR family transcriptional regulator